MRTVTQQPVTKIVDPTLTFAGAARTVTGSKTIVETPDARVLVDCGLFQGHKHLRLANWREFPVDPASLDAVVLTHAHIDHVGYLPRLRRLGFAGPVYATEGTRDLAAIVLPDSGHLQEEEAEYANRKGYSKHAPAEPLYTEIEARESLRLLQVVPFCEPIEVAPGVEVTWRRAGHILGAASLHLDAGGVTTVFSGDLGRPTHPLFVPPDPIGRADAVVVESTYGDEEHLDVDADDVIADVIEQAHHRRGVVVVPAFAVDRTEVVLWHLDRLTASGRIPPVPIVVDSPMATKALDLYRAEVRRGSPEVRPALHGAELFTALDLRETRSTDESKELNGLDGPLVIVSASGMATGGRVVHHLARRLSGRHNTVLLVGFQAPGTRGDQLRHGAGSIRMFGEEFRVNARVVSVELSTHADRSELLDWVDTAVGLHQVIVNHGEEDAARALAAEIRLRHGLPVTVPGWGEHVDLVPTDGRTRAVVGSGA